MSWVKHRDKLHEAALSSIKSISKIKTLTSKNGIPQRPPSFNQAILTSTPRSTKDLPSWRGEADFQAFWYLFHKTKPDVDLSFLHELFLMSLRCHVLKFWDLAITKVLKLILLNILKR